jgi:hypothetical protein
MPVHFAIDAAARLVAYAVEGDATPEEAREFLDAVLARPDFERGFYFLGDRRAAALPDAVFVREVAREVRSRAGSLAPCRWAVVVPSLAAFGMVRMWGVLTERSGVEVVPFTSPDEAIEWLGLPAAYSPPLAAPAT